MTPSEELALIERKMYTIIGKAVVDLFGELQSQAPVDTGAFKTSWDLESTSKDSWRITNNMEYATILFDGRRLVGGQWYGSDQWPEGGLVMLERFNRDLARQLDGINYGNS